MYTEDGFELRPLGDTMEIYASGEIFHEPEPPVIRSIHRMQSHFPTGKLLCDVRLAAYILEPDEREERATQIAGMLKDFTCAVICMTDQRNFIDRVVEKVMARQGKIRIFPSKAEARDWLESQPGTLPASSAHRPAATGQWRRPIHSAR